MKISSGADVHLLRMLPVELVKRHRNSEKSQFDKYSGTDIERFSEVIYKNMPLKPTEKNPNEFAYVVEVNDQGKYKNKKFNHFIFGPWLIQVSADKCWRKTVKIIVDLLYIEHKLDFEKTIQKICGKKRVYFSKNKTELKDPYLISSPIESSGWYAETNLSANNAYSFIQVLASAFGYDEADIKRT